MNPAAHASSSISTGASAAVAQQSLARWRRLMRRWQRRHRRLIFATLLAISLAAGLAALAPAQAPGEVVIVAARDLAAGATLAAIDLRLHQVQVGDVPAGAARSISELVGTTVAGAVRSGEVITDARVLGPGLLQASPAGTLAVPVRIAETGLHALLRPGVLVDVFATSAGAGPESGTPHTQRVVRGARVLATEGVDPGGLASGGTLLVLAADEATASALAQASAVDRLAVALRAG